MSNYISTTNHPETGIAEPAFWIDDYFGRHRYGVRFSDGRVFTPEFIAEQDGKRSNRPVPGATGSVAEDLLDRAENDAMDGDW